MKLSVIIPSFNEMDNLKRGVLEKVESFLSSQKYDFEILIVDDGSTDGSIKLIEGLTKNSKNVRLIKNSHGGKAIAVMTGLLDSKGDIGLFTDMDQATPVSEVEKILPFSGKLKF